MKQLLPLGSVVLLERGIKKLLIIGRLQINHNDKKVYDYSGCAYPDGLLANENIFLFNHEDINVVCYRGFENDEEAEFQILIENYFHDASEKSLGDNKDENEN